MLFSVGELLSFSSPKMEKAANGAQPKDSVLVPRHIRVLSLNVVPSSSRPALALLSGLGEDQRSRRR